MHYVEEDIQNYSCFVGHPVCIVYTGTCQGSIDCLVFVCNPVQGVRIHMGIG